MIGVCTDTVGVRHSARASFDAGINTKSTLALPHTALECRPHLSLVEGPGAPPVAPRLTHWPHLHAVEPVEQRLCVGGQPELGEAARDEREPEVEGDGHEKHVEHAGEQQHTEHVLPCDSLEHREQRGTTTAAARGTLEAMNIPISCGQRHWREVDLGCGEKRMHTVHTKLMKLEYCWLLVIVHVELN